MVAEANASNGQGSVLSMNQICHGGIISTRKLSSTLKDCTHSLQTPKHTDKLIIVYGLDPVFAIQGLRSGTDVNARRVLGFGDGAIAADDAVEAEDPAMLKWTKDMCL
jgi:hypothetical protein